MKAAFFLFAVMLACAPAGATSFCITVYDVCCDDNATAGSHQLQQSDSFEDWYIVYDTGSKDNKVTIICELDGTPVWSLQNRCGCGEDHVDYPTANGHLITIKVKCQACADFGDPCESATARVAVYTPSNSACHFNCFSR